MLRNKATRLQIVAGLMLFSLPLFAQPSNDNCSTPTVVPIPSSGSTCVTGTTVGATSDMTTNTCDTGTPGNEVWYTYTVTGSQNTVTVTPTGSPSAQQVVVSIQSTNCSSGTYNTCAASATNGGAASVNWTYSPGTQVLITVETNGAAGGFQLCITSVTPPPSPGSSCASASTLCNLNSFSLSPFPNNNNSLSPSCFFPPGTALQQPVFYEFTVGTTGSMVWQADPTGAAEYDWAVYNVTSGCPGSEVACNYNFASGNGSPVGMQAGPGTCNGEFCDPITVTAGNTYVLIIDNYSGNNIGFNMSWAGSTFTIAPNPQFTVTPATGCAPMNVCFTNTSTASSSYSWNFGNGNTSTSTNPACQTYSTPGTYLPSLTATSSTGCTATASQTIVVSGPPVVTAGADINFCSGSTGNLGTTSTSGVTYAWSPTTGLSSSTISNPTVTLTNGGTSNITSTYTLTATQNGCSTTDMVVVTVKPIPVSNAGADVSFCSGGTANLGFAGAAGVTYAWSPTTGLSNAAISNPSVTLTNTGTSPITSTYTLTATLNGCTSTDIVVVTVNPYPVANAGPDINFCSGSTGNLGVAPTAGVTYAWSPGTGLSSTSASNPTVTLTNTGTANITSTYTLTATLGTCTTTDMVVVTVKPIPVSNAGTDAVFCSGGSATLGAASTAGVTYAWSPTTGLSSSTISNPTVTLTNTGASPTTTTYTVTSTLNSCTSTDMVVVTVNPYPVADAGANISYCSGSTGNLGVAPVAGVSYSWSPTTGLSSAAISNPTVTLTNTGAAPVTSTYTLSATVNGCLSTDQVLVTVNPIPVANAGADVSICVGSSTTIGTASTAGYTYSWSPSTNLSSTTISNPTASPSANTTYTVSVTSAGCVSSDAVIVSVGSLIPSAGADVSICNGSSTTLTATGGTSYTWSPATGLSATNTASVTATPSATTTYTVTATQAACTGTDQVIVTVNPLPVSNAGADVSFCSGASGTLGAATTAGYTYLWSPATGLSSTTVSNPTVTLTNTGATPVTSTYTVTTSASGCSTTDQVLVTVNPIPVANAGIDVAFCSGASSTIGSATVAGVTYTWTPSTGLSSSSVSNPTVTLTNAGATPLTSTYTVTAAANGCSTTDGVVVTVNPIPAANAGADIAYCSGSTGNLGSPSVSGMTYLWSPSTGLSNVNTSDPTVTLTNPGTTPITSTYTVTVSSSAGCSSTDQVVVTVNPIPVADAGADVSYCSGLSGTFGVASVAGYTYTWSPSTGLSSTTVSNPTATLTNSSSTPLTITYTLSVTASGCTSSDQAVLTVFSAPVADAGADIAICSGATGNIGAPTASGYSYTWSPATGLSSSTASDPTVTLTNTGTAPITFTYTLTAAITGCQATDQVVVTVNPVPVADAGADVSYCSGSSGSFGTATTAGYTYSWSPSTGLSSTSVSNPTATVTNTSPTPLTITYTVSVSSLGCSSGDEAILTVLAQPTADAGADITQCSGATGNLGSPAISGFTYTWSPATGLSSSSVSDPTVTLSNPGTTPITTTYTVTAAAGSCSATDMVVVTVNPIPVANAGADVSYCSGGAGLFGTSSTAGYAYSWTPSTGLSSTSVSNPSAVVTNSGLSPLTITYTVSVSANGCSSSDEAILTVYAQPTADAGSDIAICSGATGNIGAPASSGFTYSWSPTTGLSSSSASDPSVTLTNPGTTPVTSTFTVTASIGTCSATDEVVVTINPIPVSDAGADIAICSGASGALGSSSTPGYMYTWTPTTGLSSSTVSNPTVTLTNSGSTPITATYTVITVGVGGCYSGDDVIVTVNPIPVSNAGQDITICSGDAGFIGTGTTAGYSYSWSPSTDLSSASVSNPTVTITNTGSATTTYTYTVSTTANGCVSTDEVVVMIAAPITAVTGHTDAECNGACDGQVGVIASGGILPYTYSWSGGLGSGSFANNVCAGSYTVTITDDIGCTYTTPAEVVGQPAALTSTTSSTNAYCNQPNGTATVNVSGGTGVYTYSWAGNPSVANVATGLIPGTYTVTYTDENQCSGTATVVVGNIAGPTAGITGNTPTTCNAGADGTLTVTAAAGTGTYTYSWNTTPSQNTATANGLSTGNHCVTVTDSAGCTVTVCQTVNEPTVVSVTTSSNVTICQGTSTTLTATGAGGNGGPYTYSWSPSASLSSSNVSNPVASPTSTTTYTVTATDYRGCVSTAGTVIVTLNPPLALDASGDATVCLGFSATLTGLPSGGNGGPYTISWNPPDGLSVTTGNTVVAMPTTTTTYTATVSDGCTVLPATDIAIVTVNQPPVVQFSPTTVQGCYPVTAVFENTTPNSNTCAWTFGDGSGTASSCSPSHVYEDPGTYNVSLTVVDFNGCQNTLSLSQVVTVHDHPTAGFTMSPQPTTIVNPQILFSDSSSSDVTGWIWHFADLDSSYQKDPRFTFPDTGTYSVQQVVINQYGCRDSIINTVRIDPEMLLYIPNAFSPNGDGVNDKFGPVGLNIDPSDYQMVIFDRWGNRIFTTTSLTNPWDGKANNGSAPAQQDVYIWKITARSLSPDEPVFNKTGTVTIVK